MAVNISLTNIDSLQNETTAIAAFTANNEAIINAFEDCVALDGTSPNQMLNILDMNSQQIVNLPQPSTANSPLRLQDLNSFIGGGSISVVPSGGSTGEALVKKSNSNYDMEWSPNAADIVSGSTGITLSGTNPTTITLNLSNANTWAAKQTFTAIAGANQLYVNAISASTIPDSGAAFSLKNSAGQTAIHVTGQAANMYIDYVGTGVIYVDATTTIFRTFAAGIIAYFSASGLSFQGTSTGVTTIAPNNASATNYTLTLPSISDTLVTLTASQTLTNKTLTSPIIGTIVNTGTLTLPTATDTLVARTTTDTLTNKTINGGSNTLSAIANASLSNSAITIGGISTALGATASFSPIANSISGNVALNNTSNYFDGPSVAQGTSGTWFVSGTVTVGDSAGGSSFTAKLWDGTTTIASTIVAQPVATTDDMTISLSGYIVNPAGNLRISVKDTSATTGSIIATGAGTGTTLSTITAIRIG